MKTLLEYLKCHKHKVLKQVYNYFPSTKEELKSIIIDRIKNEGNECDLNDIDVSKITNTSYMFYGFNFNGNISKWNMSNVETMEGMFYGSEFNGNISKWDVGNVKNMSYMFNKSNFNGNISNWDVSQVKRMVNMFKESPLEKNPPKWYKVG